MMFYGINTVNEVESIQEMYNDILTDVDNFNKIINSINCLNENSIVLEINAGKIFDKIKKIFYKFLRFIQTMIGKLTRKVNLEIAMRNVDKRIKKANGGEITYKVIKNEDFNYFKDFIGEAKTSIQSAINILNSVTDSNKDTDYGELKNNITEEDFNKWADFSDDFSGKYYEYEDEKSNDAQKIKNILKSYNNMITDYIAINKKLYDTIKKLIDRRYNDNRDSYDGEDEDYIINPSKSDDSLTDIIIKLNKIDIIGFSMLEIMYNAIDYFR